MADIRGRGCDTGPDRQSCGDHRSGLRHWLGLREALLAAGVRVVLIDRARDRLTSVCDDLGPRAMPLVVDLTDTASVAQMLPGILALAGGLDIFHANAGA